MEVTTERANAMASFPARFGRVDDVSIPVTAAMLSVWKCVGIACLHVVSKMGSEVKVIDSRSEVSVLTAEQRKERPSVFNFTSSIQAMSPIFRVA